MESFVRAATATGPRSSRGRGPRDQGRFGLAPLIFVVILILGLFAALAIEPTRHLVEQRDRISGMSEDLSSIERSNKRLEARIDRLKDPDFLEQRAREQIGLVRPGEITYVVMPPSRGAQSEREKRRPDAREPLPVAEPGVVEGFLMFVGLR